LAWPACSDWQVGIATAGPRRSRREIQRPFGWETIKVRNLLDSLYQGYPVGYLIAWRNPTVRPKDGTQSDPPRRPTAFHGPDGGAARETVRIRIAFHPQRSASKSPTRHHTTRSYDDVPRKPHRRSRRCTRVRFRIPENVRLDFCRTWSVIGHGRSLLSPHLANLGGTSETGSADSMTLSQRRALQDEAFPPSDLARD
jgi:hypothetical protein